MHPYVFRAFPTRVPQWTPWFRGSQCDKTSYRPSFPKLRDLSWMMWGYCCWSINFIKTEKLLLLRKKRRIAAGAQKTKNKKKIKNHKMGEADGYGFWVTKQRCPQRSAGIVSADVGDSGEEWVPRRRRAAAVPGACWVQSTDPSRNLGPAWQRRRPTTQDTKLHYAAAAPPGVHSLNCRMNARRQNQQKKQKKSWSRWCIGPTTLLHSYNGQAHHPWHVFATARKFFFFRACLGFCILMFWV